MNRIATIVRKAVFLVQHNPKLLLKKLIGRIVSYFPPPKSPTQKRLNGVLFEFDIQYYLPMKMMYYNHYAIDIVEIMKRILNKGDTFIDVGANVGYLSAMALGFVGKTGQVHSFEPTPEVFRKLEKIATLNKEFNINPKNAFS